MKNSASKLETITNISIIVFIVLLSILIVKKQFFSTPSVPAPKVPIVGNIVSIDNFDWSKHNKNVVLVLRKGCRFCTESAEFYKRLIQLSNGKDIGIIAALPQNKEEGEEYVNDLGISGIEVFQSPLDSLQVGGTPTIIVVDNKGEILNVWVGMLPIDKEAEVINQIIS